MQVDLLEVEEVAATGQRILANTQGLKAPRKRRYPLMQGMPACLRPSILCLQVLRAEECPLPPMHLDNLWHPVAGDHGAHGRFDSEATPFSTQYWLSIHRGRLATAGLMLWAGWAALHRKRRRKANRS